MRQIRVLISEISRQAFGSQLRQNMSSGVIRALINILVMFVSYPLYLHYLGYEKYGVWLILATVLSFAQMGNLGITQAITKLVAEKYGESDYKGVQSYTSMALIVLTISGIIAFSIIYIFRSNIVLTLRLTGEDGEIALWLLPYIGLLSLYVFYAQVLNSVLMGLGRMDLANYIQLVSRIAAVAVALLLLFWGWGVKSLLIGNALSYVVIHLSSFLFIKRIIPIKLFSFNWDRNRAKQLFTFGGGVFGSSVLGLLVEPFNKLMLSRYAGVATIPVFEIAFRGAVQIRSLLESGLRAIMPEISRLSGVGTTQSWQRIKQITLRAIKLIVIAALPMYAIVFIAAPFLLRLWLREQYTPSLTPALRVMLIGSYLSLLGVPAFHTIMGLGKVKHYLISSIIGAGGNFVAVTSIWALTGHVSVHSLGICLIFAFGASTFYSLYNAWYITRPAKTK